jgi:hypothetical protein
MGMGMNEKSIGQEQALEALIEASKDDPEDIRINVSTLRLIVELAWKDQSESEHRTRSRQALADLLAGEIAAAERRSLR